ncbi:hypothetical protein PS2_006612 [Malus domestica]
MLRVKIADKLYPRKFVSRSWKNDASLVFEQAILSAIWLLRFGDGASSIFEKAILLGVWLLRFGERERCLFDF